MRRRGRVRGRRAHDGVEAGAVVAGGGGDAGAVAGGGSVCDEAGLCAVIGVIAGEHETLVGALRGELGDQTRREGVHFKWRRVRRSCPHNRRGTPSHVPCSSTGSSSSSRFGGARTCPVSARSPTRSTRPATPRSPQCSTASTPTPTSSAASTTHSQAQSASRLYTHIHTPALSHVHCRTVSGDNSGPIGQDPAWLPFADLHRYLQQTFPTVFVSFPPFGPRFISLQIRQTERHTRQHVRPRVPLAGLYQCKTLLVGCPSRSVCCPRTFHGHSQHVQMSSLSIRPLSLSGTIRRTWAIMMVSPSSLCDACSCRLGTWIWGRGTCDDKADLIQKLVVIDALLQHDFTPARTIVLAFGFDEESTGQQVRPPPLACPPLIYC